MSTITQQRLPVGTWTLDPVHSSATFAVRHMVVATYRSRFDRFDATLAVGENGAAELTGTVDVDSIEAKDENLAAHLASAGVLRRGQPSAARASARATSGVADDGELTVDGQLTIKGRTAPVAGHGHDRRAARGHRRHREGRPHGRDGHRPHAVRPDWNAPLPKGGFALANDVTLRVELELAKA